MLENTVLFDGIDIGPVSLENRIMSSGHQTTLVSDHLPTDEFEEYHLSRARGGAGLIVLEAHAVDESGLLTSHTIDASGDEIVDAYEPFADAIHEEGTALFAQLFHGGRERYADGYAPPAPAPSDVPTDRLQVIPRSLGTEEVYDLIDSFAAAAERMERAGLDGVEIVGSHGYLPAQFWSPHVNNRDDEFGGDLEARCRFTTEIVDAIRDRTGAEFAVGVRLSAEERHRRGLALEDTMQIVERIDGSCDLDYWSVVVGSSSTPRSCRYIVPPATESDEIVRHPGEAIKRIVEKPVIVTSRIDTPEKGVDLLEETSVDVVGMTRAMIADPAMPRKARDGAEEPITPCVACNQGCIGRYQDGLSIRCTVNPETGRETEFADVSTADEPKRVVVVGGGPAGLTCAAAAAEPGHDVTLFERADELGGQVRAYADLPHRGAFDDWISVLEARLENRGVDVRTGETFDPETLESRSGPLEIGGTTVDDIVLATGATGRVPDIPIDDDVPVYTPTDVLRNTDRVRGDNVLVADWDGNQAALDVATVCSDRAADVELVTGAYAPGENVQQYIRNDLLGQLDEQGVRVTAGHRVAAIADDVVLENVFNERRERRGDIDAVVFSHGGRAASELHAAVEELDVSAHRVGDCWAPRSLDEAVREGYETGVGL